MGARLVVKRKASTGCTSFWLLTTSRTRCSVGIFWISQSFRRRASDGFFHPLANERSAGMFTRIVELTTKPRKNEQLSATINDKVLPILKRQKGFVDEMVFVSDKEDNRVLSLSFWNRREDAEEYHRVDYPKVHDLVRNLIEAEPMIRTFD